MFLPNDPQSIMPILYPALGAACLSVSLLLLLTYWVWDRAVVILALAVNFALEAVVMMLLTFTTGVVPYLELAEFRQWVVLFRFMMLINLAAVIFWQIRRFSERGIHG